MPNDWTHDTFFDGKLSIKQARSGYRFSIDAVILASAIQPGPKERIVDLGTGCGVVPLLVAFRHPDAIFLVWRFRMIWRKWPASMSKRMDYTSLLRLSLTICGQYERAELVDPSIGSSAIHHFVELLPDG